MATQLAEPSPEVVPTNIETNTIQPVADNDGEAGGGGRDWEAEASNHGWTGKEQFKGDPDKWVDAETFMRRADEVLPFIKKQNAHLKRELDDLKRTTKRLMKSEQDAHREKLEAIAERKVLAVEAGDVDEVKALDAKADKIREDMATEPTHGEDPNDEFDNFRDDNSWYDRGNLGSATDTEKDARAYADRLAERYARQGLMQTMAPSDFFAKIAEDTKAKFPMLGNGKTARAKPISDVAGVTRTGAGRSAKIGANLPPDAKQHAERYMRMGISDAYRKCKSKAEAYDLFAKTYAW